MRSILLKQAGFWVLPFFLIFFIAIQAYISAFVYGDYLALTILLVALVALVSYLAGGCMSLLIGARRELNVDGWKGSVFRLLCGLYLGSYLGLYYYNGGVPILELYLHGGVSSLLRASFYKEQEGVALVLVYIRSLLTRGFIPFAIVVLFCTKTRFKFYVYLIVVCCLSVSAMEKSLLIWAVAPLLFFQLVARLKADIIRTLAIFALFFCFVSYLSLGDKDDLAVGSARPAVPEVGWLVNELPKFPHAQSGNGRVKPVALYNEPNYQFELYDVQEQNKLDYMLNRVVWIPFVTVYDTVLYWKKSSKPMLVFGVNRYLASLFGYEFSDLERQVFRFQYGSGEGSLGNANAAYIAEAYVGFGYTGVAIISLIVGLMYGWVVRAGVLPFICALPVISFGLLSASFLSMLFSGGLMVFLICVLFFSRKVKRDLPCL